MPADGVIAVFLPTRNSALPYLQQLGEGYNVFEGCRMPPNMRAAILSGSPTQKTGDRL